MVAKLTKVKVVPKELKAIPDILPYRVLLEGDPAELELTKKEILRCMNFGDVYDLTSGEEVLIDEISFKEIVEYVEETAEEGAGEEIVDPVEPPADSVEEETPVVDETEGEEIV